MSYNSIAFLVTSFACWAPKAACYAGDTTANHSILQRQNLHSHSTTHQVRLADMSKACLNLWLACFALAELTIAQVDWVLKCKLRIMLRNCKISAPKDLADVLMYSLFGASWESCCTACARFVRGPVAITVSLPPCLAAASHSCLDAEPARMPVLAIGQHTADKSMLVYSLCLELMHIEEKRQKCKQKICTC